MKTSSQGASRPTPRTTGAGLPRAAAGALPVPTCGRPIVLALAGLLLLAAGLHAADKPRLTVAAAANLAVLGPDLARAFEAAHPGEPVDFVFGASGALVTQIKNGAPFHVFLSADTEFPAQLEAAGLGAAPPRIYASGTLVLLSTTPRDFARGLALLAGDEVKQFAIANPETAPYGRAAREALAKAGLWEKTRSKAVIAQNIGQALQYSRSATGIGFVNKSALFAPDLADTLAKRGTLWMEIDPRDHAPLDQAFIVLKSAGAAPAVSAAARNFAAFLASEAARAVFRAYGYAVPRQ